MNSYKVLKFDDHFVYLTQEGKIKKLARDLFDFDCLSDAEPRRNGNKQ